MLDFIDTTYQYYNMSCSGTTDIENFTIQNEIIRVTDQLGRDTKGIKNEVLFYIYDDGTVEKKIIIE